MLKWNEIAGRAAIAAVVASATIATAEETMPLADVVVSDPIAMTSYDEYSPEHTDYLASTLNPSEPQETVDPNLGVPEMDLSNAVLTSAAFQAPAESAFTGDMVPQAASSSDIFSDSIVAPSSQPATTNVGSFYQPRRRVRSAPESIFAAAPAPGFLDYAPVRTRARIRYDRQQNANDPTRGEFLFPTLAAGLGPEANGPTILGADVGGVRFDEFSFYFEFALLKRLSLFIDTPIRFVGNVDLTGDGLPNRQDGIGDVRAGFKFALIEDRDTFLTTQFVVSTPTGDSIRGVGTGNTSLDIGLLYQQRASDNVYLYGEFRDWFTLDAPTVAANTGPVDLNSNILRYGLGVGVDLLEFGSCRCGQKKITGLFEVTGFTVLDGFSTSLNGSNIVDDATDDTIVNGQYGLRYTGGKHTTYVGFGQNYTTERLYRNSVRVQYSFLF